MRAIWVFRKVLRETRRDLLVVALTLIFAPVFVILYYVAFPSWSPAYRVALVNRDTGAARADGGTLRAGEDVIDALAGARDGAGREVVRVSVVESEAEAQRLLERREASAVVVLGADFSGDLVAMRENPASGRPTSVTMRGDLSSPGYAVTAVLAAATIDRYVRETTGRAGPLEVVEQPLGGSGTRSEFELYVPGILVFSVIMLVFLAAMTVARESESGAIRRLRLTRMTAFDFLAGTSAVLLLIATAGVLLTFGTALALGFHSLGPVWVAILVTAVTALSVIGVGMMVAAWARSVTQAFVIANFPLGLLMFFSGAMFPIPHTTLFHLAGRPVGPVDLLPPTHAVNALNKIFTLGAGIGDATFELTALAVLTVVYFAAGVALLHRFRLRAR